MSHKFFGAVLLFASLMIFSCKCKDHKHQSDEHLTHEFVAVEGTPIFDVPQDSTFDVNKVGTVSFNGIQAYYLKRNFNEKLKTEGKYVYQMPEVFVRKNNLGNMEDVTKPFIDIYTEAQITRVDKKIEESNKIVQEADSSYIILSCKSTGLKACYNMASIIDTALVTTILGNNLFGWEFECHFHTPTEATEITWITFINQTQITDFHDTISSGVCHSLIILRDPLPIQYNNHTYLTFPYNDPNPYFIIQ